MSEQRPQETLNGGDQLAGSDTSADFRALLHQYGEAMIRIGRLEGEVASLVAKLGTAAEVPDRAVPQDSPGPVPPEPVPPPSAADGALESDQGGDELLQMRIQIAGMSAQLSANEGELREFRGARTRRRRRDRDKRWPLWRRVAKRLGLPGGQMTLAVHVTGPRSPAPWSSPTGVDTWPHGGGMGGGLVPSPRRGRG